MLLNHKDAVGLCFGSHPQDWRWLEEALDRPDVHPEKVTFDVDVYDTQPSPECYLQALGLVLLRYLLLSAPISGIL